MKINSLLTFSGPIAAITGMTYASLGLPPYDLQSTRPLDKAISTQRELSTGIGNYNRQIEETRQSLRKSTQELVRTIEEMTESSQKLEEPLKVTEETERIEKPQETLRTYGELRIKFDTPKANNPPVISLEPSRRIETTEPKKDKPACRSCLLR